MSLLASEYLLTTPLPVRKVNCGGVFTGKIKVATLGPDVILTYFTFRCRLGCLGHSLKASKQSGEYFLVRKYSQNIILN